MFFSLFWGSKKKNECFPGGHLTWAASPEGTLATPQPGRFHHVTSPSPTSSRPGNASPRIAHPTDRSTGHRSTASFKPPGGVCHWALYCRNVGMDDGIFFRDCFTFGGWKVSIRWVENCSWKILERQYFFATKTIEQQSDISIIMFHDISWYAFLFSLEDTKNLQVASGNPNPQVFWMFCKPHKYKSMVHTYASSMCPSWGCAGICSPKDSHLAIFSQTPSTHNWTKHHWADLELPDCHRHSLYNPRSRRIHLPASQQRQILWPESAAHPWADLELPNCHHHAVHHPKSRQIHLKQSQQRPEMWPESAAQPFSWSRTLELSPPKSAWPQVTTDPSSSIAAKANPVAWICCTPFSWSWTAELSPPCCASPQVATDPSETIAAKARNVAWICCTPFSWSRTLELSPPKSAWPQVTTDPSSSIAAKAEPVAWICCTPFSWSRTLELSPPKSASPQVTTDPSETIAAKARNVAWICCTPFSWSRTLELSPPKSASPQVTTDPSETIAAKARNVAWICCTPWSWSWTAELSPPKPALPQVTTDPYSRIAAKALFVAWICCTPLSWSRTAELSPPKSAWPQVATDPSSRIAAKAVFAAWICCTPLSWSRTTELSPPQCASPQVTILLSPWHHNAKGTACCCQLWLKYQSCNALSVLYLCFF